MTPGSSGFAMTVDIEEWYHSCFVPAYVRPERRPDLPEELDRLVPEVLDLLAEVGRSATFFVLGEVAARLPGRIREIAAAGHEVGSHGDLHLRARSRPPAEFFQDILRSKGLLEDLLGRAVEGFRAPEWSLRSWEDRRLRLVAEAGFRYDSSLAPYPGAGRRKNPPRACRFLWPASGLRLMEFPPLTFGGWLRLPAVGWAGRLAAPEALVRAASRHRSSGAVPVAMVHPWELAPRPTPGELTGLARLIHETGRPGFTARFRRVLMAHPWQSLGPVAAALERIAPPGSPSASRPPASSVGRRGRGCEAASP